MPLLARRWAPPPYSRRPEVAGACGYLRQHNNYAVCVRERVPLGALLQILMLSVLEPTECHVHGHVGQTLFWWSLVFCLSELTHGPSTITCRPLELSRDPSPLWPVTQIDDDREVSDGGAAMSSGA